MSKEIERLLDEKRQVQNDLDEERRKRQKEETRREDLGKQIDQILSEKKKLTVRCNGLEKEVEDLKNDKRNADQKGRNSYQRFEDAMKKVKELEESLDDQEKVLIKRHNEMT